MRAGHVLLLIGVVLTGCTGPIGGGCTEMFLVTGVEVDTGALDLPAGVTGRVCLDDECADVAVDAAPVTTSGVIEACVHDQCTTMDATPLPPAGVSWERPIPDVETVQVTLTLTDAAGAVLWSGSAAVDTEVVEPNGPGCGQTTVLPDLRATPDGRLVT